jgi:hypothetical protein
LFRLSIFAYSKDEFSFNTSSLFAIKLTLSSSEKISITEAFTPLSTSILSELIFKESNSLFVWSITIGF